MRITSILNILNVLGLFILYTITVDAAPTLDKRQEVAEPDFNTNIFTSFLPLEATKAPETRDYTLRLSRAKLSPDGFERVVWTSNGQYPGPMIRANKGDRIVVTVINNLEDYCTIHWHGIFQVGTTYYDGVAGQTQCLIPNGSTFVYNFTTGEQYGTYWWHSHFLAQYVDGLRGPLIIHDPNDPFLKDYDEEFVMTLSDWHHTPSEELIKLRMAPGYDGFNPIPDAGLISGVGRYDCSKAPEGSTCKENNPFAVYMVQPGKRYRIRIINTSAEAPFTFSIDNHPLRVIECEGENIKPIVLNKINIAVGQRYSVIITADQAANNFWIRATIIRQCLHYSDTTININSALNYAVTGILRYQGAPEVEPTSTEWDERVLSCRDVDHNLLKLYTPRQPPQTVTDSFTFNITFGRAKDIGVAFINNRAFIPDLTDPTANKIMLGGDETAKDLEPDQNAFIYDTEGGAVEITLLNENIAAHPFHLHGHNFYVMGHGEGYNPDPKMFNLIDPAVRDTVTVLPESWTVIRYNIDNPGVWAFHCHIEWHVEMGMVGQLIERPSVLKTVPVPQSVRSICPKTEVAKRSVREYEKYYKRRGKVGMVITRGKPY